MGNSQSKKDESPPPPTKPSPPEPKPATPALRLASPEPKPATPVPTPRPNSAAKTDAGINEEDLVKAFAMMLQLLKKQPDGESTGIRHRGVTCDVCKTKNFSNYRYRCLVCNDFDLCSRCFDKNRIIGDHQANHPVVRFDEPNQLFGDDMTSVDVTMASLKQKYGSIKHEKVNCDGCGITNIVGLRFKCHTCKDYDLCFKCNENKVETLQHKTEHVMIVVGKPKNLFIDSGDFDFVEKIGQGAFGAVYKAKYKPINQTVAIKIIDADTNNKNSETLIKGFVREVEAYSEIKATNILRMHGYSMLKLKNKPYLALITEYMGKGSLAAVLEKEPQLSGRRRLFIAHQISCGMVKIHERGFIHRDIRPDNILVDENYEIKIGDMGIAREYTKFHMTQIGCKAYMPPEFYQGEYDLKLDIYTFGLTLNEIYDGTIHIEPPFVNGEKIKKKALVFGKLIDKCTSKRPEERPEATKIERLLAKYAATLSNIYEDINAKVKELSTERQKAIFINFCSKIDEKLKDHYDSYLS